MRMMDGSEETGTWWPTQKFRLQAKVQFMGIRLHLFLNFLLVVVYLPSDVNMHRTPFSWFPQHGPEWIRQPGVFLQKRMRDSSGSCGDVDRVGSLGLKCALQRAERTSGRNHWRDP